MPAGDFVRYLRAAQRLSGARVHLPEARFREFLAEGRITVDDLDAALADAGLDDLDAPVWRVITRRDVLLASLRLEPEDAGPARQAWEAGERPAAETATFFAAMKPLAVSTPVTRPSGPRRIAVTGQFWMMSTPRAAAARA